MDLATLLSSAVRPSQNVESNPVNWRAFMAEQMRNIPPLANDPVVPPPMGGQLGQLSNSAGDYINQVMARGSRPRPNYVFTMPDQPPYDPTQVWNQQHR